MSYTTTDKYQSPRHHIGANDTAGNTCKKTAYNCILEKGIF